MPFPQSHCSAKSRRGAAVILILGLLAITLATTYALTRSQFRSFQIHGNSVRRGAAKQAALNGLAAGLRKMHDSDWGGIGSTLKGNVSATACYSVAFTTGDAALSAGDSEFDKYPYRVTITSTGTAQNPSLPAAPTTFVTTAVVELTPRRFSATSPSWTADAAHTIRQWQASDNHRFEVEPRFRVEGNVHVQGAMKVCAVSPLDWSARRQWLGDLNERKQAEGIDHRPFNGRVDLDFSHTSSSTRNLLTDKLGLSIRDVNPDSTSYSHPGVVASYRLYPGGIAYDIPLVAAWLTNISLGPDVKSNPLGVYASTDAVTLDDNVTIDGTLIIGSSDLKIVGENVILNGGKSIALDGGAAVRLPSAIVRDDIRVDYGSGGELHGLLAVWDEFELKYTLQDAINFSFDGRLLCKELLIRSRTEWTKSDAWWEDRLSEFRSQEHDNDGEPLFCKWLEKNRGLPSQPILTVRPESGAVAYHWHDWSQPIYAVHPDDDGLRWQVIRWGENP